ncbi:MAG: HlyD family type I secretion periplasmic adaptor subunit [Alphaproteobacteria bacterium]|jgi:HlyD family type I secretion membrane fusion protein|nr:HlyD family type I secretion periplasmic adaptor subunit [Alphaproteobacteria bacterium]
MPERPIHLPRLFRRGYLIIALVFGGLLAWSVLAPFEGAVVANGSVTVESEQKAVQHLEGGIVKAIHVREGDQVSAGAALLELSGAQTRARLAALEKRLAELAAREARLAMETGEAGELVVRNGLETLPGLDARLKSQATLMQARRETRENTAGVLENRIRQLRTRMSGLRDQVAANQEEAAVIASEMADLQGLYKKGLAPRTRILALQRNRSSLEGARAGLTSEIATTQVRIGETQIELDRLVSDFREKAMSELSQVRAEMSELIEERSAARDRLDRLVITAPKPGHVIGVRAHTVGGVIKPGEPVMFIVPEDEALVATVRISPADIDKVHAGQPARLRFSAFSQDETPEIEAQVLKVRSPPMP